MVLISIIVDDFPGNTKKTMEALDEGKACGTEFLISPELAFYGHLPIGTVMLPQFISNGLRSLDNIVAAGSGPAIKI